MLVIENKIDSIVPAYMHIENYSEHIIETSVGTGILLENTDGIIRKSVYDESKGNVYHTCIFPLVINEKEYPIEIVLESYDGLKRGYGKLPSELIDLWDGDNQLVGKWKKERYI